jgi:carboxymethylenebutenolidase
MCFDSAARPPLPPIAGGAGSVRGADLVLTASDGNRFAAFTARATDTKPGGGPGIVILPDVRGLHEFYRDLALRFAEAGVHATAFDFYGRTAGLATPRTRGDDFEYMPHMQQARPDTVARDVAATVDHVRSRDGGGADAVFTVGFCFGGRQSFNQAGQGLGLAGVIGFYGVPQQRNPDDANAPVMLAKTYACPVLGLFGSNDHAMSTDDIDAFRRALDAAGVENEIVVYDGAPHSFFDRTFHQYRKESEDAWNRMLRFIAERA